MTDKQLAACPFCGRDPEIETRDVEPQGDPWYGKKTETFVLCHCGACLFDGAFHEGFGCSAESKAEATRAWNRRAAPAAPTEGARDAGVGTAHADVLRIVHEESGRTLSKADFDMCVRIAKRAAHPDPLLAEAVEALENAVAFIEDAHIIEGQWHWDPVVKARAILAKVQAAKEGKS